MLPEGCDRIDFRDPKIWKENDTYYLIVGNKNDNQVGQVVLCSSKNLTDWKFETILASNENGDIGTMWECPDFFALKDKHVLICSPQDMKARKYEFHNGHNSVYFWETTMQTDADSAKNSRIHLIMVWISMLHRQQNFRMADGS